MRVFHEIRTQPKLGGDLLMIVQIDNLCFRAHWHQEVELLLVTEGEMIVYDQKSSQTLRAGELAIFGSGDHHAYQTNELPSKCILLIFPANLLGNRIWPYGKRFISAFATHALVAGDSVKENSLLDVHQELLRLLVAPKGKNDAERHLLLGMLHRICGLIFQVLPTAAWSDAEEKLLNSRLLRLQNMLERVESHYRQEITATEMAKQLNLSYHHFTRLFTEYVGMGFQEFVNSKRLQDADELLATTDLSITEVAFRCGFNSLRTFNRLYRSTYQCAPSDRR